MENHEILETHEKGLSFVCFEYFVVLSVLAMDLKSELSAFPASICLCESLSVD